MVPKAKKQKGNTDLREEALQHANQTLPRKVRQSYAKKGMQKRSESAVVIIF